MKSHDQDCLMDALLREHVIANCSWPETDEEIDALLNEEAGVDPYTTEERSARVKAVLEACGEQPVPAKGEQLVLFDTDMVAPAETSTRPCDLFEIVRLAYRAVHDGWSSDRLIADPDMGARFIQACWKLGAQASQFDLNHLLINARKRKIIGKTDNAKKYHVDPAVMDQYWFASEFAARIIQDREFLDHHRRITVDHILCDPRLASTFDDLAKTMAPGFTSLDYRWAALAIRKARSRAQTNIVSEDAFQWLGRLDSIKPKQIEPVEGFLWVRTAETHIYIGHGRNLQAQIKKILDVRIEQIMAELPLFSGEDKEPLRLGISEHVRSRVSSCQPNNLVRGFKPCLNVLAEARSRKSEKEISDGEERRACGAA